MVARGSNGKIDKEAVSATILERIKETGDICAIVANCGICVDTYYKWRRSDPIFKSATEDAIAEYRRRNNDKRAMKARKAIEKTLDIINNGETITETIVTESINPITGQIESLTTTKTKPIIVSPSVAVQHSLASESGEGVDIQKFLLMGVELDMFPVEILELLNTKLDETLRQIKEAIRGQLQISSVAPTYESTIDNESISTAIARSLGIQ